MKKRSHFIFMGFLIIFCVFLYGYGMGKVGLSDPDETFYAETAKEMLHAKSFVTPLIFAKPQFEKPPMFYWLIILSSLFKGMNEFAVRFAPALFGTIGVMAIYFLGNILFNRRTAIYASFILATNFLYLGLSRCALTDIVFSVFVLLSLLFFFNGYQNSNRRRFNLCLFFLFSALAVLTKGPLGILIPLFTIIPFLMIAKDFKFLKSLPWVWGIAIFVLVAFPWYILMALKHKEFLRSFFFQENIERFFVAEHKSSNRWYFYPSVFLGASFPWSILFPLLFVGKEESFKKERLFLKCWFWFSLIFFTAAQSKLASYILPIYPALCLMLARSINRLEEFLPNARRLTLGKLLSTLLALVFLSGFTASLFWLRAHFPDFFAIYLPLVITIFAGLILAVIFLWFNNYKLTVLFKTATVLIFILLLMSNIKIGEGAFSDKDLPAIIRQNSFNLNAEIVCSKLYARGVYFYAERNVVVINDERKAFFRPHPIVVISDDKEITDYFKRNKDILCVLTRENLERLNSLTPQRKNKVISKNFDRYVVISSPSH